jgi:hypothetical protein
MPNRPCLSPLNAYKSAKFSIFKLWKIIGSHRRGQMLMQVEFESRVKNGTIAIPKATPLSILQEKMKGKAWEAGFNNIEDIVGYIKKIRQ